MQPLKQKDGRPECGYGKMIVAKVQELRADMGAEQLHGIRPHSINDSSWQEQATVRQNSQPEKVAAAGRCFPIDLPTIGRSMGRRTPAKK